MGWIQKTQPNLDDKTLVATDGAGNVLKDWYCWCLAVTQASYGIKEAKYASAEECWNRNQTKHTDGGMNIPIGPYYVPVFYTGGKYGHVVICNRPTYEKVRVWSSPLTHKPYFDYFEGDPIKCLDSIGDKYGCKYAGWTETLTGTRIIEWVSDPVEQKKEEEKKAEEKLDEIIKDVEKPVEKEPETDNMDVEKSENKITQLLRKLIEFLKSLL